MHVYISQFILLLILIDANSGSDRSFDVMKDFIEDDYNSYQSSGETMKCKPNNCQKIEFSLPNMKFYEVWKEGQSADMTDLVGAGDLETSVTASPYWPNPPAIWGQTAMGQQLTDRSLSHQINKKGPIVTNLDKIIDVLRPISDNKSERWLNSGSNQVMHKVRPQSRNDNSDDYYDYYETRPKSDEKRDNKRNLMKIIIEQNEDNKDVRPEVVLKKKKRPTIVIEEEMVPEREPKNEFVYKFVKKPKPKPKSKTKHIFIEEEVKEVDGEEEEEQEIVYEKNTKKKEKPKEMFVLMDGNDDESDEEKTSDTRSTSKPSKKRKIHKKSETQISETSEEEPEDRNEWDDDYDYESERQKRYLDEEAWGSASPQSRVKPSRSKTQQLLNPLSMLQRLRPNRHPHPHHNPHNHNHNIMTPGGTFRMRFYLDGPHN